MWDFRLVDCANFLLQPSKGHTYGRSPVWIRTCVRKLKSRENRLPQPSNVHCQQTKMKDCSERVRLGKTIYVNIVALAELTNTRMTVSRFYTAGGTCGVAHLKRFLSCVYKLMPLQLWAFNEGLATLCTDVHAWPMSVQVFPHCRVIPEHFGTPLTQKDARSIH